MSHRFDPTCLREYDIRGVIGRTLSEKDALALGRTFGTLVRRQGGRSVAGWRNCCGPPARPSRLAWS